MLRSVAVWLSIMLFATAAICEEQRGKRDDDALNVSGIATAVAPLAVFMAYHRLLQGVDLPVIGRPNNHKTHIATALMCAAEAGILVAQYPSRTFNFNFSFLAPAMTFGIALNLNKLMGRPIEQTTAVKAGRLIVGVIDFAILPLYWIFWVDRR